MSSSRRLRRSCSPDARVMRGGIPQSQTAYKKEESRRCRGLKVSIMPETRFHRCWHSLRRRTKTSHSLTSHSLVAVGMFPSIHRAWLSLNTRSCLGSCAVVLHSEQSGDLGECCFQDATCTAFSSCLLRQSSVRRSDARSLRLST